jgi:hypothetical protein
MLLLKMSLRITHVTRSNKAIVLEHIPGEVVRGEIRHSASKMKRLTGVDDVTNNLDSRRRRDIFNAEMSDVTTNVSTTNSWATISNVRMESAVTKQIRSDSQPFFHMLS